MTKALFRRKGGALLGLALLSAGITCTNFDRTSPVRFSAAVGLIPAFSKSDDSIAQTLGTLSVTINNVHILLLHEDGSVVVDTTIAVGPNDEEVELELEVSLSKSSEALSAAIELRSGTMVLFSGTQHIVVLSGAVTDTKQDTIAVTYSGPGATAASLVVSPKDSTIRSVDSIALSAVAKDAQGAALNNLLIGWSVKDPTLGSVSTTGVFHPANADVRGSTYVVGVLPTGLKDSARVFVIPAASQVVLVSGGGQSGAAGSALASPLVVEVRAKDNLPVPGVTVDFAATVGGGSVAPASAVSAAAATGTGQASATLTLGTTAGPNAYTATIAGAIPLVVNETAVAGAAARLIVVTKPPANSPSGVVFVPQPVVRIADANGNTVTTSTASVTASASAGYALSGTVTISAVAGVVAYTDLGVSGPVGSATIGFASSALSGDSASTAVSAAAPASITVALGDNQSALKNQALTDSVVLIVKDGLGNGIPGVTPTFTLPGGGTSSGPSTTDAAGRIARRWTVGASGVQSMDITAGAANVSVSAFIAEKLVVVSEPTASPERGVVFAAQPKVQVQDNQGHQVKVANVSVGAFATLVVLCDCSSPVLSGTTTLNTDANGEAQFTDLMLFGTVGGLYHLRFDDNSESLTSGFSQNQTLVAGVATHLAFNVQPPNATIGAPFSVSVQAMTAGGFVDNTFGGDITVAIGATPGGALTGTLTATASSGAVTFSDLVIDQVGVGYTLVASSGALTNATSNTFSVVAPVSFTAIAVPPYSGSGSHTCGISTTNSVYCWGRNTGGEMGAAPPIGGDCVGSMVTSDEFCPKPIQVQSLPGTLTSLTAGGTFTCGLNSGTAYCWGYDGYISQAYAPNAVGGTTQFSSISAGANHMCGIDTTGALYCWGYNGYGNLGNNDGTFATQSAPSSVYGGGTYLAVSAGQANTCAIASSGIAYCWGDNSQRQLGNSVFSTGFSNIPVQVTGAMVWSKIATGQAHACGIDNTGATYCWGDNTFGQTGDNLPGFQRIIPSPVAGGHTFVSISSAEYFTCAVDNAGAGYCWGRGDAGQLGNGGTGSQSAPTLVAGSHTWASIQTGYNYACGVTTDNKVYCWGQNPESQLGIGSTGDAIPQVNTPTLISAPGSPANCNCAFRAQPVTKKKG